MPIPKVPVDLRASGLRRTAYDLLLDAIVRGDLAPGQRLHDEALEARFGTTRSAVRAALAELEAEWLVRIVPRKGTFVTELDLNRGLQAVEVLAGVTMRAVRESAGLLTRAHLDRLTSYRGRWLRGADTMREALLTSQEDDGLYGVFFELAGNPELDRVRDWVLPYVRRVRHHLVASGALDLAEALRIQRVVVADVLQGDLASAADRLWEGTSLFGEYRHGALADGSARPGVALSRDLVADTIEAAILDGTLVPDEPLPETELMGWLGVSHTPVRQALDALANRGLVEQQLNRSARVARLDPVTIRGTFIAYGVLIRVALRRAMRLDRAELLATLRPHQDRYGSEPEVPVSEVNAGLNLALFGFSGAQVLGELSERMASRLTWYVRDEWDARSRPDAVRLSAELRAAVAAEDDAALDRIVKEAYDDLPFGA
ncbi:GntR family transcriptional regulator [Xylanimonas protaetiae]|uniref:GntR family transcriptional regulator n=1 Tax=Xylanimonas protaetiae TaxID=2509457 RepID=UPI0013EC21D4|nr:GntR family transcriptional regulator [Xylanimonas protaetiae]